MNQIAPIILFSVSLIFIAAFALMERYFHKKKDYARWAVIRREILLEEYFLKIGAMVLDPNMRLMLKQFAPRQAEMIEEMIRAAEKIKEERKASTS